MAREYFCAYHSFLESLTPYGDAEVGRLFRYCLQYSMTGEEPDLCGNERFIWPTLKAKIDGDKAAYASTCAANKENGSKGGRPKKKPDGFPENRAVFSETENNLLVSEREESEKEERPKETPLKKSSPSDSPVKEITPEKYPGEERGREDKTNARARTPVEIAFDAFWAAYPKKVGKKDAFRAFQKVPKDVWPKLVPAVETQKRSRQWQKDEGMYIPNPATWLNQGRWDDEGTEDLSAKKYNRPDMGRLISDLDRI